jgi:hypothetical protein
MKWRVSRSVNVEVPPTGGMTESQFGEVRVTLVPLSREYRVWDSGTDLVTPRKSLVRRGLRAVHRLGQGRDFLSLSRAKNPSLEVNVIGAFQEIPSPCVP